MRKGKRDRSAVDEAGSGGIPGSGSARDADARLADSGDVGKGDEAGMRGRGESGAAAAGGAVDAGSTTSRGGRPGAAGAGGALSALGLSVGESEGEKAAQVEQIEHAAEEERSAQRETVEEADALLAGRGNVGSNGAEGGAATAGGPDLAGDIAEGVEGAAIADGAGVQVADADGADARAAIADGAGVQAASGAGAAAGTVSGTGEASASEAVRPASDGAGAAAGAGSAAGATAKRKLTKRTRLSVVLICIAIPIVVALGLVLGDTNFYVTSVIIMVLMMLPFFVRFEGRKPQARELVVIAVMIAIAAASRAVFIWLPSFSPLIGIAIITAIALGPEQGFITGALAAFVSNFLFGQGPWTPWQMFAYGIGAFLAGILYRKGILKTTRASLAVYGFLVILLFVGPLLDTCTVFTVSAAQSVESVVSIYVAGISYNVIHGIATALTLVFLANPLCEKIERIKVKYGMGED